MKLSISKGTSLSKLVRGVSVRESGAHNVVSMHLSSLCATEAAMNGKLPARSGTRASLMVSIQGRRHLGRLLKWILNVECCVVKLAAS